MEDITTMVAFAGSYSDRAAAQADFDAIKQLFHDKLIGRYQAAIFEKVDGKVKILNTESTTRTSGAKWGLAVGAVAALMFPPLAVAELAGGTAVGALTGNVVKGWGAEDIKRIGADLDDGELGVLLVAHAAPDLATEKVFPGARRSDRSDISHAQAEVSEALDSEA